MRAFLRDHPADGEEQVGVLFGGGEKAGVHAAGDDVAVGVGHALGGEVVEERLRDGEVAGEFGGGRLVGQDAQGGVEALGGVEAAEVDEDGDAERGAHGGEAAAEMAELGQDREDAVLAQEGLDAAAGAAEGERRRRDG
jgi:hypothetical protein